MGDLSKEIYEHMKCLYSELLLCASGAHTRLHHTGSLSECTAPMCAHYWKQIDLARELEQAVENPDYVGQFRDRAE